MGNLRPALPSKLLPLSKGESDCNGHICVSYGSGFRQAVKCCVISLDRYQPDGLSPPLTVVLTGVPISEEKVNGVYVLSKMLKTGQR